MSQRQSSLGASLTAWLERPYRWTKMRTHITSDGRYLPGPREMGEVQAAVIANRKVVPSPSGFGKWELIEAPLMVIRGTWEDGQVDFPGIQPGDRLVDEHGQTWEVMLREEWREAGLLVLTVKTSTGGAWSKDDDNAEY